MSKTGRNDPCPCGSGKKYKKCCLAQTYDPPGREDATRKKVIDDLLAFCKRHYKDEIDGAFNQFWGDFDPELSLSDYESGVADINFWEWMVFDWKPDTEKDKTLIDLYMEKKKLLSQDDVSMLQKMKQTNLTLFEVQYIFLNQGLIVKDLLVNGEYDVKEKMATRGLRKWDLLAGRILQTDGNFILTGSMYIYFRRDKGQLVKKIRSSFRKYKKDNSNASMQEFLKKEGCLFNRFWVSYFLNPPKPGLLNTSGDPLLFSKATFEIKNKSAFIEDLKSIESFEQNGEDQFVWLDKIKDAESPTILGNMKISKKIITVETNSKERLEKLKGLLNLSISGHIKHKADSFQDPFQAVESSKDRPGKTDAEEVPLEIQQELMQQFYDKHYKNWLNEKIPALANKTPLESVKTPTGKNKVIELLKQCENSEEQNRVAGQPGYDFSWMWEKLGLEKE